MMKYIYIIPVLIFSLIISCAKDRVDITILPGTPKWKAVKELADAYSEAETRGERIELARKGIGLSEACIKEVPKDPACHYWHAVITGLYYKSKVVGYQKGLKEMIADCERVIDLDPSFEHGGAYLIIGQIYTEVPGTSHLEGSIIRDLDRAIGYLKQAVAIAPDYPENYTALASAYLKADDKASAGQALLQAKALLPRWRDHDDYPEWIKTIRRLNKKLKK